MTASNGWKRIPIHAVNGVINGKEVEKTRVYQRRVLRRIEGPDSAYSRNTESAGSAPEVSGEQNDDGEQFKSSGDHQRAHIDLEDGMILSEFRRTDSVTDSCAGVGEHGDRSRHVRLQIESLHGQDHG